MIGSLNSTNYLKPVGYLNKIKIFFKKHHSADIKTQYEIYRVRAFDLHIDFKSSGKAIYKYDGIQFETFSIYDTLNFLEKKGDTFVRIALEDDKMSKEKEKKFYDYCKIIEKLYSNIVFFGGYRTCDIKQIYKFNNYFNSKYIKWISRLK